MGRGTGNDYKNIRTLCGQCKPAVIRARAPRPAAIGGDGSASGLEIEQISAPGATMTVKTKATGPAWHGWLDVALAYSSRHSQNAWANFAGLGWRKIQTGAPDGVTNMLALFAEAKANNKQIMIYADSNFVLQSYHT